MDWPHGLTPAGPFAPSKRRTTQRLSNGIRPLFLAWCRLTYSMRVSSRTHSSMTTRSSCNGLASRIDPGWTFRAVEAKDHPETQQWHPAAVPGVVQTDLLHAGLIPDPFFGDNEKQLQWIGLTDWEYRTEFSVDAATLRRKHIDLVFDGLDTFADVTLNGHALLHADNMFRTWRAEVRTLLKPGNNVLTVVFHSPINKLTPVVA